MKGGDILIFDLHNEMCQRLEDFHNSGNKYFSSNQRMMLQIIHLEMRQSKCKTDSGL